MTELDDLVPQMKVLINGRPEGLAAPTFVKMLLETINGPVMKEAVKLIKGLTPYAQVTEACRVFNAIHNFGDKEDDTYAVLDDLAVLQEKARRDKELLAAGKPTLRVSLGELLKRKAG